MYFRKKCLPSVGHKIPIKALISSWKTGSVNVHLDVFKNAYDVVFASSGTAALGVILHAIKEKSSRKKVILPAYTCPSLVAAVEKTELEPVLCDINLSDFNINEHQLRSIADKDTLAVIIVHLYGLNDNIKEIKRITKDAGAVLIEDAAQSFGNLTGHKYAGTEGDISIISFGRGKPLSVLHGGAIIVNTYKYAGRVRESFKKLSIPHPLLRRISYRLLIHAYAILFHPILFALPNMIPWFKIGQTVYIKNYSTHTMLGAAKNVLSKMLCVHNEIREKRCRIAKKYLSLLEVYKDELLSIPNMESIKSGPLRFPIVFKEYHHKEICIKRMNEKGLGVSTSYPCSLNKIRGMPLHVAVQGPFHNADRVASGIITLPTHELVTERDIVEIIRTIGQTVNNRKHAEQEK